MPKRIIKHLRNLSFENEAIKHEHQGDKRPQDEKPLLQKPGVNAGRLILYLVILLIAALFLVNFILPSVGVGGCIAVLSLDGEIATVDGYGVVGSENFVELLQKAAARPDVRGIMIEINSPGGSVVASREIYSTLVKINKTKVAYISEMGASGGYYVAIGADYIYADPASITGSIGAVSTLIDVSKFMNKTGIDTTTIKSGELKDIGSMFRPMTENETRLLETIIKEIFNDFKDTVLRERSGNERFTNAKFEEILDARILSGKQAYERGLIDALGTRQEARAYLGEKVGLGSNPTICRITAQRGILSSLMESVGRGIGETLSRGISIPNLHLTS
jgi:protease-4